MDNLELTNTIGQMKDKINEIINSIEENVTEIKLYNVGETQYVTITFDGTDVIFTDGDGKTDKITLTTPS